MLIGEENTDGNKKPGGDTGFSVGQGWKTQRPSLNELSNEIEAMK